MKDDSLEFLSEQDRISSEAAFGPKNSDPRRIRYWRCRYLKMSAQNPLSEAIIKVTWTCEKCTEELAKTLMQYHQKL